MADKAIKSAQKIEHRKMSYERKIKSRKLKEKQIREEYTSKVIKEMNITNILKEYVMLTTKS